MINPRRLAAIDIAFLGSKFIIAEFAGSVLLCLALGSFILWRGSSLWQLVLALYFFSLGLNYVPMLIHAIALTRGGSVFEEIGDELNEKRQAMTKYRRQALYLLVPFVMPIAALRQWRHGSPR